MVATATSHWLVLWLAAVLLLVAAHRSSGPVGGNGLSISVGLFAAWLCFHTLVVAPVFKPEAIFTALFLCLSFVVAARLDRSSFSALARGVIAVTLFLSLWGLLQHWADYGVRFDISGRAHAAFPSPNTLATLINFVLLGVTAHYLSRPSKLLLAVVLILFLGTLATQSRGGFLALACGLGILILLMRGARVPVAPRAWVVLASGLLVCILLATTPLSDATRPGHIVQSSAGRLLSAVKEGDTARRMDLYGLALRHLKEKPWLGHGYLGFKPVYRSSGEAWFHGQGTSFVHNDYLQIWLETGILGLLGLLAIIFYGARTIWKLLSRAPPQDRPLVCALGGALATLFAHAAVDLPLYAYLTPILLGLSLGAIQRLALSAETSSTRWRMPAIARSVGGVRVNVVASMMLAVWLFLPAGAALAASWAQEALARGDPNRALLLYTVSQTAAPYNPYYYWTLGVIWSNQAFVTEDGEAAMRANDFFSRGIETDRSYPLNHVQRLNLHREHGELLSEPASGAALVGLARALLEVQPSSEIAQIEYVRTLHHVGDTGEAKLQFTEVVNSFPGSRRVRRLAGDLGYSMP